MLVKLSMSSVWNTFLSGAGNPLGCAKELHLRTCQSQWTTVYCLSIFNLGIQQLQNRVGQTVNDFCMKYIFIWRQKGWRQFADNTAQCCIIYLGDLLRSPPCKETECSRLFIYLSKSPGFESFGLRVNSMLPEVYGFLCSLHYTVDKWRGKNTFVTISILRNTNAGSSLPIGMEYHHQKNDIINYYQFPTRISVEQTKKNAPEKWARGAAKGNSK